MKDESRFDAVGAEGGLQHVQVFYPSCEGVGCNPAEHLFGGAQTEGIIDGSGEGEAGDVVVANPAGLDVA